MQQAIKSALIFSSQHFLEIALILPNQLQSEVVKEWLKPHEYSTDLPSGEAKVHLSLHQTHF